MHLYIIGKTGYTVCSPSWDILGKSFPHLFPEGYIYFKRRKGIAMKKVTVGFVVLFMMILAACGGSESAKEVYENALAAGEEMESAELDMTIHQTMSSEEMPEGLVMDMDMQSEMTLDPIAMYQAGTISFEMDGMPFDTEMEMYVTDSDFYMYESMSDTWLHSGEEMMPTELMNMEQNPTDQLEILESFIEDVEFEEEEDFYVFRYSGDGEELLELSQELIKENLGEDTFAEMGIEVDEILDQMTIHSIFYEILIEKDTYNTESIAMDMDVSIEEAGETLEMKQEMNATYTGINTIDSIEVPQEVIDSAESVY